jgi:hypothetical protein
MGCRFFKIMLWAGFVKPTITVMAKSQNGNGQPPKGGKPQMILGANESEEMLLNKFAVDFYYYLRPSKLMTTNDIAQFTIDWKNENKPLKNLSPH